MDSCIDASSMHRCSGTNSMTFSRARVLSWQVSMLERFTRKWRPKVCIYFSSNDSITRSGEGCMLTDRIPFYYPECFSSLSFGQWNPMPVSVACGTRRESVLCCSQYSRLGSIRNHRDSFADRRQVAAVFRREEHRLCERYFDICVKTCHHQGNVSGSKPC